MSLQRFTPTSDKNDKRLQFCHYYVIHGLFSSTSAHLIGQFNPVSQMKLIDSSFEFIKSFSEKCIASFERINDIHNELVKKEDAEIVSAAKNRENSVLKEDPITPEDIGSKKLLNLT